MSALENLRKDIRMRLESDSIMSTAWLLVYLIPVISLVTMFSLFVVAFVHPEIAWLFMIVIVVLSVIGFIVSIVLIYKLVKRRNTHFKRQTFLFEDALTTIKDVASKKDVNVDVELSSCERTLREMKAEETEKSAALWAILSAIIFIATWYVYYFLMKDFYKHERREEGLLEDVSRVLSKCDIAFTPTRRMEMVPDRSFVLYLILSIITLGLFNIYWLYVLIKDPNNHFKYHIHFEDELLKTLESAAA
ncbi:MAG: DUF4234 domain-containing protein [Thermoproteota archaeon]|nr:DUF4234 domain-containing protein [Thermoproteota archaeon]